MKVEKSSAWLLLVLIFSYISYGFSISPSVEHNSEFIAMFYNLENLFDTINNPEKADDEFTPDGARHWTSKRYQKKLENVYRVICAVDYERYPDIVGVCEVENREVLEDLTQKTPLKKAGYSIYHRESCDRRGIDVAILYNKETFKVLDTNAFVVRYDKDSSFKTRDILYMKGLVRRAKDTLHVFVNHWPSRYGGEAQTVPLRQAAGRTLRHAADSVLSFNPNAKILCLGDFNDTPANSSLTLALGAKCNWDNLMPSKLYNISYYLQFEKKMWTYAYYLDYDILDQVIVSGGLLVNEGLRIDPDNVYPLKENFLLDDPSDDNPKPFRTYNGYRYKGGFSDHLPMIVNFELN